MMNSNALQIPFSLSHFNRDSLPFFQAQIFILQSFPQIAVAFLHNSYPSEAVLSFLVLAREYFDVAEIPDHVWMKRDNWIDDFSVVFSDFVI